MYGLIGKKLGHSFSPQIHKQFADYDYRLFEMDENDVGDFLKKSDFEGINVTIPYKKTVIPYLDELSDCAKKIGSVNTVKKRDDNTLYGDNTDYFGFRYTLESKNISPCGKKCIILGSGGASLTAKAVLSDMNAKSITVISRSGENNYSNISKHFDAEIIINTTPVGMYPDCGVSPIRLSEFKRCEFVFDLIYNPSKTALLLEAEKCGISYANGLTMLVAQAKKACEIFTGKNISNKKIDSVANNISMQMLNIVLVGMPGCGKSTLGKLLAEKLGRTFIDSDCEIVNRCKESIPDIFSSKGELFFREIEKSVINDCGKQSSAVIATGGGTVLCQTNIDSLRQNGIIFFINRDINELARDGRPLSSSTENLKKLYDARLPLYRKCADIEIKADTSPSVLAGRIIDVLNARKENI